MEDDVFRAARTFSGGYYAHLWLFVAATKAEAGRRMFDLLPKELRADTSGVTLSKYVATVHWCPDHERLWFEMAVADAPRTIHPRRVLAGLWGGIEERQAEAFSPLTPYDHDSSEARVTAEQLRLHDGRVCALVNARQRVALDAACSARNDFAARRIAQGMLASGDYSAMPILADALEEAGCDSAALLAHARQAGGHHPGCWVVGLVLGKG
jgi:hypothetical protein